MFTPRILIGFSLLGILALSGCRDDRVIAPEEVLPPVLAIDRPNVQLFRFARGRKVEADTVRISNNGEGPLGIVEQVGGVDYITTARTAWLRTELINTGDDQALLVLYPTYAEDEQDAADIAEVVLKAQGSPDLKRVQVVARTLRGASFEFSVSPLAFAAVPGDSEMVQQLTVRNGGNGTLQIHDPLVRYVEENAGWLSLGVFDPSPTSPTYLVQAQPGELGGGLFQAYLIFESPAAEETRAKADSVLVQLNIGKPVLAASTSDLTFSVVRGDEDPPAQGIALSNAGEGAFSALGAVALGTVTYGDGGDGWLNLDLAEGLVTVSVTTAGMEPGDYQASFQVVSVNGGGQEISVALSVEAPILTATQRAVAFGMVEGDASPPPPQRIGLTNSGAGPFGALGAITLGALSPAAPWVSAAVLADTVVLTPTPASTSLTSGDYSTTLPIQSQHGGSDAVTVTLSVSRGADPAVISLSATQVGFSAVAGGPDPVSQVVQISNAGGQTLGALSLGAITYGGGGAWLTPNLAGTVITLSASTGALGDGTYTATLPVQSENGGSSSITVTFTVGSPVLTASSTSASFSAVQGGGNPSDQTLTLSNTGPGDFTSLGTVSLGAVTYNPAGTSWLSPSLAGNTVTLAVATGALVAGTYSATLPVNSTGGGNVTVTVTFTVTDATASADLVVSPASVSMDAVRGGSNPPSQTVILSNAGGGTLGALSVAGVTYGGGASGWLSHSLVGATLTLDATTGALAPGSYTATVNLSSTNGGNESVGVTFNIGSPVLTLASASASFSGVVGGAAAPASTSINLSNTGSGDFSDLGTVSVGSIVYGSGTGWLAAAMGGGGTQVDITPTLGPLAAGTYTATVPVNSTSGGNGSISVTLTVAPAAQSPALALSTGGVTFSAVEGGGDPSSVAVTLFNSGGGDFAALGTVSLGTTTYNPAGTAWLSSSLGGNTVTLSATTGALTAAGGPYTATVPVQSTGGGTQSITITFNIAAAAAAPVLAVSPASVRVDAVTGGSDPANEDVLMYNAGDGSLGTLSVGAPVFGVGSGWLSSSKVSSTARLSFDISGLTANTYTANVPISTSTPADGTANIAVTLVVSDPALTVSATSAEFSGQAGGAATPASVSVTLSNTGAGTFSNLGAISLGATT